MECTIYDKSVPGIDKLQTISTLVSWHTILSVAKSRNHAPILLRAEFIRNGEFPSLQYHNRYRNLFVTGKYK